MTATTAHLAGSDRCDVADVYGRAITAWLDGVSADIAFGLAREQHLGIPAPPVTTVEVRDCFRMAADLRVTSESWS
jgi:hypothetical protein